MTTAFSIACGFALAAAAGQVSAQVRFYEDANFSGRSFDTARSVADFNRFGFNDKASSVIVRSGRWDICSDANFGGRCVSLRPGRYPDLNAMGLNDAVSSARRAGERRRDDDDRR